MINFRSSTVFCILSIISCTVRAVSDADNDDGTDTASRRRVPKAMKQYFRDTVSPLQIVKPLIAKRPAIISLLNLNGPSVAQPEFRGSNVQKYRNELLRLIVKAMEDVETNRTYLKTFIHQNPNESKVAVRVGDLVKFVESKYNKLLLLYTRLRTNKNSLLLPNLVNAYGEILRGRQVISTILEVLQRKRPDQVIFSPNRDYRDDRYEAGIAWSYYDDNF